MIPFDYIVPQSLGQALNFLQENGKKTKILAGGTDLLIDLRRGWGRDGRDLKEIKFLLDLGRVSELSFIEIRDDKIAIGPLTTHRELSESPLIREHGPLLSWAAQKVGSVQIRNLGTIGGNVVNASPAADLVPVLVALGAELKLESYKGERSLPIESFYLAPYQTVIRPEEILTEISFPKPVLGTRFCFLKLARRKGMAKARMNLAVMAQVENGLISDIRISPGSTTPIPGRISSAEDVLKGKVPTSQLIFEASLRVSEEMVKRCGYRWSTEYKKPVIETLTRRALHQVLGIGEDN